MTYSIYIALYLFSGGTAAGCFAVMCVFEFAQYRIFAKQCAELYPSNRARKNRVLPFAFRNTLKIMSALSLGLLAFGVLCLLADLGRPHAALLLFSHPTTSYISVGAFALAFLGMCMIIVLTERLFSLGPAMKFISAAAKILGVLLAIVIMVYTGLLLKSVIAVRLWNSLWLSVLFLFSSLSCGCSLFILTAHACSASNKALVRPTIRKVQIADLAITVLEIGSLVAFALAVNDACAQLPFNELLFGEHKLAFWAGFVLCALVAPLVMGTMALVKRNTVTFSACVVLPLLVLIGGFFLRYMLIVAGVNPAL